MATLVLIVLSAVVCFGQTPNLPKAQSQKTKAETANTLKDIELKQAEVSKIELEKKVLAVEAAIAELFMGPLVNNVVGPSMSVAMTKQKVMSALKILIKEDLPVGVATAGVDSLLNQFQALAAMPGQGQKQQVASLRKTVVAFVSTWSGKDHSEEKKAALRQTEDAIDKQVLALETRSGMVASDSIKALMHEFGQMMSSAVTGVDSAGGPFAGMSGLYSNASTPPAPARRILSEDVEAIPNRKMSEAAAAGASGPSSSPAPLRPMEARPSATAGTSKSVITELDRALREFDSGELAKALVVLDRFQKDDVRAACRIGLAVVEGRGGRALDVPEGIRRVKAAADSGDSLCMAEYGMRLYRGWGVGKSRLQGVALIERSAESGSSRGKAYLAGLHTSGRDVALDCSKAKALIDVATESGDPEALAQLGIFYYTPSCKHLTSGDVSSSAVTAVRKAQGKGSVMATFILGTYYHYGVGVSRDSRAAVSLYKEAISHGNPWAMINLGWFYLVGEGGLQKDVNEAIRLYTEARDLGDSGGGLSLGELFVSGEHTQRDIPRGLKYLNEAVEADDAGAMRVLGEIYGQGKYGISQNGNLSIGYLKRGCDANDALACMNGGEILARGKVVTRDLVRSIEMIEKAVSLGNVRALLWLGSFYEHGQGKPQNFQEAMRLYQMAQSKGDPDAPARIRSLVEHMRNPRGWRGAIGLPF